MNAIRNWAGWFTIEEGEPLEMWDALSKIRDLAKDILQILDVQPRHTVEAGEAEDVCSAFQTIADAATFVAPLDMRFADVKSQWARASTTIIHETRNAEELLGARLQGEPISFTDSQAVIFVPPVPVGVDPEADPQGPQDMAAEGEAMAPAGMALAPELAPSDSEDPLVTDPTATHGPDPVFGGSITTCSWTPLEEVLARPSPEEAPVQPAQSALVGDIVGGAQALEHQMMDVALRAKGQAPDLKEGLEELQKMSAHLLETMQLTGESADSAISLADLRIERIMESMALLEQSMNEKFPELAHSTANAGIASTAELQQEWAELEQRRQRLLETRPSSQGSHFFRHEDDLRQQVRQYFGESDACFEKGDFKQAVASMQKALQRSRCLPAYNDSTERPFFILSMLGAINLAAGDLKQAKDSFQEALQLNRSLHGQGDRESGEADVLHGLGLVSYQLGDLVESIHYLQECLQIKCSLHGFVDHPAIAHSLNLLMEVFFCVLQPALQYLQWAMQYLQCSSRELRWLFWWVAVLNDHVGHFARNCVSSILSQSPDRLWTK